MNGRIESICSHFFMSNSPKTCLIEMRARGQNPNISLGQYLIYIAPVETTGSMEPVEANGFCLLYSFEAKIIGVEPDNQIKYETKSMDLYLVTLSKRYKLYLSKAPYTNSYIDILEFNPFDIMNLGTKDIVFNNSEIETQISFIPNFSDGCCRL